MNSEANSAGKNQRESGAYVAFSPNVALTAPRATSAPATAAACARDSASAREDAGQRSCALAAAQSGHADRDEERVGDAGRCECPRENPRRLQRVVIVRIRGDERSGYRAAAP